LYVIIIIS